MTIRVLIVDDHAVVRAGIQMLLESDPTFEIVGVGETGLDAVRMAQEHKPDVILMDITMPEMDGLTALKEIRSLDANARVAMVTALGQQQIVLEAVKSGAKDFLVKPCEGDRVLAAVSKLCA